MHIAIYVAIAENGVIGSKGGLPWRLSSDLKRFKAGTMGKPIIMGRKTWESFPKRPLPGRPNIVATRNLDLKAPGAFVFSSLPPALAAARAMAAQSGIGEVSILGGAEIYEQALDIATLMTLTEVDADREADVFFPKFDRNMWRETSSVRVEKDADNEAAFVIRELERRA
jgi:dihydrofolate reductase